jgi:signal transduction histidine kinase
MSDTGDVSELPPPRPPSERAARPVDAAGTWETLRSAAVQWLSPLLEREGWLAVASLFVGMVAAAVFFALTLLAVVLTAALSIVLIGLLLVVPTSRLVERFAGAERALVGWSTSSFELRLGTPLHGIGPRSIATALTDPVRWRQVGFIAANVVIAPILYAIGILPYAVVAQLLLGANILPFGSLDLGTDFVLALPLAVVVAGAGPRFATWAAERKRDVDAWFLGPDRLAEAVERVATLTDSRQDVLDAVASERRRIERNLHDGVQQQLVAIGLDLGMALDRLDDDPDRARERIESARSKVQGSIGELRQIGRGLHPAILADRGLDAALSAVIADAPIPVSVRVDDGLTMSREIAEVLYFVANEAVANVLKHADARVASVHVDAAGDRLRLTVHDDGVGGADAGAGTGLAGMHARVRAVDGTLTISSPSGGPTTVVAELPRG